MPLSRQNSMLYKLKLKEPEKELKKSRFKNHLKLNKVLLIRMIRLEVAQPQEK